MFNVDPTFVQWCIATATMVLFVEKVLAACVHWKQLRGQEDKDAIHRLEVRGELIAQKLELLIERLQERRRAAQRQLDGEWRASRREPDVGLQPDREHPP